MQTGLRDILPLYRNPGATTSVLTWQMSAENDNTEHGNITTLFFSSKVTLNRFEGLKGLKLLLPRGTGFECPPDQAMTLRL